MVEAPPPTNGRLNIAERLTAIVSSLTFQNIAILALLVLIAIPSYAAYKFLTDQDFRHEFTGNVELIEAHVPCLVYEGAIAGQSQRTYVFVAYTFDGRMERIIGQRTQQGILPSSELANVCSTVVAAARFASERYIEEQRAEENAKKPTGGFLDGK